MILQRGLTNQFCFDYISKKNEGTTKGRLIRDRGKMQDHSKFIISTAATSKSKIGF